MMGLEKTLKKALAKSRVETLHGTIAQVTWPL